MEEKEVSVVKNHSKQKNINGVKVALSVLAFIVVVGIGYFVGRDVNAPSIDSAQKSSADVAQDQSDAAPAIAFDKIASLADVTEGALIQGTQFDGAASGEAKARSGANYRLVATFQNLPEPVDGGFYEGWIVRKGENRSVLSTGEVIKKDGQLVNEFSAEEDLSDHTFYFLTLEPNDGDPAPADHIVEGELQ